MKKKIKIILIILGVLLIALFFIFYLKNRNEIENNLKNNVVNESNLKSNIEIKDNLSETQIKEEQKLTAMAEKTYEKYLDIFKFQNSNIGPMPEILIKLGFETEESIKEILSSQEISNSYVYLKSNTKYEDFKNEMLKYFSKDFFEKYYSQYTNIDGYVGFCACSGDSIPYSLKTITFDNEKNEKYYFDVILIDMEMYEHFNNPEQGENINEEECYVNTKVTFIKENENLVIAEETMK